MKASSTKPRGCREAASQGVGAFLPLSSQDVCLAEGGKADGLGEAEAENDCWPVNGTLAGGERE